MRSRLRTVRFSGENDVRGLCRMKRVPEHILPALVARHLKREARDLPVVLPHAATPLVSHLKSYSKIRNKILKKNHKSICISTILQLQNLYHMFLHSQSNLGCSETSRDTRIWRREIGLHWTGPRLFWGQRWRGKSRCWFPRCIGCCCHRVALADTVCSLLVQLRTPPLSSPPNCISPNHQQAVTKLGF